MRVIFKVGIVVLVIGALLSGVIVFAQPKILGIVSNAGQVDQKIDKVYLVDVYPGDIYGGDPHNVLGPSGWNQVDFDDSSWHDAIPTWRHNAWCSNSIFDSLVSVDADWIWYNNYPHTLHHDWGNGKTAYPTRWDVDYDNGYYVYGDSNPFPQGFIGAQTLFSRKSFCIPLNAYDISGNIDITVDNEFELFINGNSIGTGNNWATLYSFATVFQTGKNVIATKSINIPGPPTNETNPAALIYKAEVSYEVLDVNLIPTDIYYSDGSLHAVIENTGSDDCPSGAVIRFYENGTEIGDQILGTVNGGGESTVSIPWSYINDTDICVAVDIIDCLGEEAIVLGGENVGRIDETDENDNTFCKTLNASITITKSDSKDPVYPGDTFIYTIYYLNDGDETITNAVIEDTLPDGINYMSSDPLPTNIIGNSLTWELGTLEPLSSGEINIFVRVDPYLEEGELTNIVSLSSDEIDVSSEEKTMVRSYGNIMNTISHLWGVDIINIGSEGTFAVENGMKVGGLTLEKGENEILVDVYNKGILKAYNVRLEVLNLPWARIEISPEIADIPKRSIQTYTVYLDIPESAPSGFYVIKIEAKGNFILEVMEIEVEIR